MDAASKRRTLTRVRNFCLALPEVTERMSHGSPAWFVRRAPQFATLLDNHHDDGVFGLWCAAPDGAQRLLVEADPEHFFIPPYVGHRGWLGVHLDRSLPWAEVETVLERAYLAVAPSRLAAELQARHSH